jgi:hypothetical protein
MQEVDIRDSSAKTHRQEAQKAHKDGEYRNLITMQFIFNKLCGEILGRVESWLKASCAYRKDSHYQNKSKRITKQALTRIINLNDEHEGEYHGMILSTYTID